MASLLNRNGYYHANFHDQQRTPANKRFSLKTKDKPTARELLVKLERDWRARRFDPWTDDPFTYDRPTRSAATLKEALQRFLEEKRKEGRTKNTLRTYEEVVRQLIQQAGPALPLRKLTPEQLRAVIRDDSLAQATQHKRYGHLRTFLSWCQQNHLLEKDLLANIERPRKPQKLPKAVTPQELRRIEAAIRTDYEEKLQKGQVQEGELIWRIPIFWLALYTGLRGAELARLRWEHIDFERRLIYIYEQKNHKQQTVPLSQRAEEVLEEIPRGLPQDYVFRSPHFEGSKRNPRYFVERASRAFRRARNQAGIERKISLHGLRHGFCTLLAEAGKSAVVIKEAARHADISTSMRYVHMANEQLKRELDEVFG